MTLQEAFKLGFKAGFAHSAEGYNAEYPFDFDENSYTNCNSYKIDLLVALTEANIKE